MNEQARVQIYYQTIAKDSHFESAILPNLFEVTGTGDV